MRIEGDGIDRHHRHRHVVDHAQQAILLLFLGDLRGCDGPDQQGAADPSRRVGQGMDMQVEPFLSEADPRLVRQPPRIRQKRALVKRIPVKHVDRGAHDGLRIEPERLTDRLKQGDRARIGVVDFEGVEVARHGADRKDVEHALEVERFERHGGAGRCFRENRTARHRFHPTRNPSLTIRHSGSRYARPFRAHAP